MKPRSKPSNGKRTSGAEDAKVSATLPEFRPMRGPVLRYALPALPFVAGLMAVVGLLRDKPYLDPMYASGMAGVAVGLVIFRILLNRLPETFHTLWIQEVIVQEGPVTSVHEHLPPNIRDGAGGSPTAQSNSRIVHFMGELDRRLNRRAQWVLGILAGTIPAIWRFIYFRKHGEFLTARPFGHLVTGKFAGLAIGFMAFVAESAIAIFVGLLVWRLLGIGVSIGRACNELGLRPQPQHPDRCGGFKPLGQLCSLAALVVTIPGVYLALWMLLGAFIAKDLYGSTYTRLYELLLVIMLILVTVSFVWPLWSVHQLLVEESIQMKPALDRLGRRISNLAADMLRASEAETSNDLDEMKKSLDSLRQVYEENKRFPLWPFDVETTTKLLFAQAISAIALIKDVWGFFHKHNGV
jgi:hypothetical protein